MATNPRSQVICPGDTVALRARFTGPDGEDVDLDLFPSVSIIQPSGGVAVGPTSQGVMRIGVGEYQFNYAVGLHPPIGTWRDVWQEVGAGHKDLQIPLRLLDAAVRYREKPDERVLLGLPIEERELLRPLLGL